MRSERCKVVVKCRPTPGTDEALDDEIRLPGPGKIVLGKDFDVDHVYLPKDGDAVYEDEVQALVGSLYEGYNSTVFAYGASGSGKTHTVLGCKKNQSPGLVDRITDAVFGPQYNPQTCAVSVSVEELYCERFTDLLAASARPPAHPPHSSSSASSHSHLLGSRGVHLRHTVHHRHAAAPVKYNEQKVTITSGEDMKELVQHVLLKRQTAATCINERSSRSHVIVTIELEQRRAITERKFADDEEAGCSSAGSMVSSYAPSASAGSMADLSSLRQQDSVDARSVQDDAGSEAGSVTPAVTTYLIGKLYLVDLAGSENIKRSGAEGARQKEAGEINKSLCHLKTVIEQVFNGRKAVTYRNSKLTFRLQDALGGGNSKLLVIACISTAKADLSETKETLRFAEMARAIKNSPMVNREPKDELIHRLELQVAELQDQLRRAQGEGDPGDVLAQLCKTETELCKATAELAGLKEEMAAQDAKWAQRTVAAKVQFDSLHAMLSASQASESSLQQQLAAEQTTLQRLELQLAAEKSVRQGSQQAGMAAAGLLLEVQGSVSTLQEHCSSLQQQVSQQQAAAANAVKLCVEQEQQAQGLQQQLDVQTQELARLKRQLQQESSARAAAEAQVLQLQRQQQAVQQAAQQCAAEASQGMQHMALLCSTLHEQASAAAAQQHLALQQHNAVASSMQASAAAQAATKRELAAAKLEVSGQRQRCSQLQQQLQQQQEEHEAVLTASTAAAALAAAEAATAHLKQRQAFEAQLQAAQDSMAKLQGQLEDERSEHEAMMRAAQLRHSQELAESMHSSVKKLTADKLRCREHLSMQMQGLKAEMKDFSQALASPTPFLVDRPESRPGSPAGSQASSGSGRSSPAREPEEPQDLQDLAPALRPSKRVSPVPPLQLDASAAALSDGTAAPMQDASERNLSGGETGSSTGSSGASSPGSPPLQAASKTAALVAVAAAAAAMTAQRLTPRKASVHVYAEAGSQGGYADSILSRGDSIAASDGGRDSPANRMMLLLPGSISGSPSLSSIDGSQHGMIHPAATAAASAAAAAVAARVRTSQEQQRRHRRRRREYAKSFTSGSWPISYKPNEAVDMAAAAAAFNRLRGGLLNVENLARFLEHRMLGNKLHSKTLAEGGKKRKHELVQDMLAYHNYYFANNSDGGGISNPTSSNGGSRAPSLNGAAASATPRSSMCSSPESALWDPLQPRPASAAPSSATSSPARLDFLRYSHDGSPARAAATRSSRGGWGSGGGSKAGSLEAHLQGKAVFAVEAADANSSRQQPDVAAPEQQQQQQSGRWSWLTPRRRKQQSILAQLQAGSTKTPDKSPAPGASPAAHYSTELPQLSVRVPRDESEGGCDAKSPRDKKHAAAASRAGSFSQPSSPGGINLSGKTISAVTGSAVAEFYVDSPAAKLGRSGSSKQRGSKGSDPMRLTVDLGGAHRSSWRQVQLLGTK